MQDVIEYLEQAQAALLAHAADKLAQSPDVAAELIGCRRQIANLEQHVKDLANATASAA